MAKRIAAVHDLSGLGKCSLTAAIPVLSALRVQACPVPTAILSNQTGFSEYYIVDGTEWIEQFLCQWRKCGLTLDGIYTGFFGNATQIDGAMRLVEAYRPAGAFLLVDPVMGDDGQIYATYTADMCRKVGKLAEQADILTPNLTEACLLAGVPYDAVANGSEEERLDKAMTLAKQLAGNSRQVVITGVHSGEYVYNLAAGRESFLVRGHRIRGHFSGTGDLFASVLCGCVAGGHTLKAGVELATRFIEAALQDTFGPPEHGVEFEQHLGLLTAFKEGQTL